MDHTSQAITNAASWSTAILENCCLMDELRYSGEQLRAAMSRLPGSSSLAVIPLVAKGTAVHSGVDA
jgi:hypothetical protein